MYVCMYVYKYILFVLRVASEVILEEGQKGMLFKDSTGDEVWNTFGKHG